MTPAAAARGAAARAAIARAPAAVDRTGAAAADGDNRTSSPRGREHVWTSEAWNPAGARVRDLRPACVCANGETRRGVRADDQAGGRRGPDRQASRTRGAVTAG